MRVTRPPPPPPPTPNMRIGPFTVVERIAVGGMAEVFRATEPRSAGAPRTVVIKRMLSTLASEPAARAMFEEEARLGSLVEHPNVVRVLGSGESEGLPYLVLEHVPGLDLWRLSRWLTRERRVLDPELAVHIVCELLAALEAVHNAVDERGRPLGLVHRDVSPSNVLLSVHGEVKLADFGIARALLSESYPQALLAARGKGKLGYLSPEQVAGRPADRRADVFAAAVIGAELLCGRPLFAGSSELAILLAIRDGDLRVLDDAAPLLPAKVVAALRRGLAREPELRIASAESLAHLLSAAMEELGATSRNHPSASAEFASGAGAVRRAALAGIVSEAMRSRVPSGVVAAHGSTSEAPEDEARTGEAPELLYRVRAEDGRDLGVLTYAKLVEALATGQIGASDLVAIDREPFRPIRDLGDLARHLPATSNGPRTQRYPMPAGPDRSFDLANGGAARALGQMLLERETGLLLFERGTVRKEVYLVDGTPEFVASNLASELLGEFLVARGVITRGELDMALAVMPRFEGRLGDTLTALGLVEPVHLFRQIASQVQEKLLEIFMWTSGRASFFRGVARPPSGFPLGIDGWKVLLEGLDRRVAAGLESSLDAQVLRACRPAPRGLARAPLSGFARMVLDRATVGALGASLIAMLPEDRRDARRARREVALLIALGALVSKPNPG